MQSGEDSATDALTAQLNILSKQEEALQRGLERTEAGNSSSENPEGGQGEAGEGGGAVPSTHGIVSTPCSLVSSYKHL